MKQKTNWLRVIVFILLLLGTGYLFVLEGNSILNNIPLIIIFWPFLVAFLGGILFGGNLFALGMVLILEMVWLYFIANFIAKLLLIIFNKIRNHNI